MNEILHIFQTPFASLLLEKHQATGFPRAFFESPSWVDGPNSTQRLTLANFQALRLAEAMGGVCNHYVSTSQISDELKRRVREAQVVVLHQVKSSRSIDFLQRFLAWFDQQAPQTMPYLVIGGEISWFTEWTKGNVETSEVESIYFKHALLRHTAKTDRPIYNATYGGCHDARIQEFPLGIDTRVLAPIKPAHARKRILFVGAPPNRTTKNQEGLLRLHEAVASCEAVAQHGYEVRFLVPPYRTVEYWDELKEAAFLVFTSTGETFSYVVNDARAMGVVALCPESMYQTRVGNMFGVESYPWFDTKYATDAGVVDRINALALDPDEIDAIANHGRTVVDNHFAIRSLASDWHRLLTYAPLNTARMWVCGTPMSVDAAVRYCQEIGADYVLPMVDTLPIAFAEGATSWYHMPSGVTFLQQGVIDRSMAGRGFGAKWKSGGGTSPRDLPNPVAAYLQMACRLYRVGHVHVDDGVHEAVLDALASVRIFANLRDGLAPVQIHRGLN